MSEIDKREKRAERKISSRYSGVGKSDMRRDNEDTEAFDKAPIWCKCGRFKDKCEVCK